jgi:hypothetical protein
MTVEEFDEALTDLETRVDRLRALYENWFRGYEKTEPSVPRKDVERRVYALRKDLPRNTALRFRYHQLYLKYTTLVQYWQRTARQIEEGTYRPQLLRLKRKNEREQQQEARRDRRKHERGEEEEGKERSAFELNLDESLSVDDLLDELEMDEVANALERPGPHSEPPPAKPQPKPTAAVVASFGKSAATVNSPAAGRPVAQVGTPRAAPGEGGAGATTGMRPGLPLPARPDAQAQAGPATGSLPRPAPAFGAAPGTGSLQKPPPAFAGPGTGSLPKPPPPIPASAAFGSPGTGAQNIPRPSPPALAGVRPQPAAPGAGPIAAPPVGPPPARPFVSPPTRPQPSPATPPAAVRPPAPATQSQAGAGPRAPTAPAATTIGRPAPVGASAAQRAPVQGGGTFVGRPPAGSPLPASGAPDEGRLKRIYEEYAAARRRNNEGEVRFEQMVGSIQKMLPELSKKHHGKRIDFEVVVKDGRVGLKPKAT